MSDVTVIYDDELLVIVIAGEGPPGPIGPPGQDGDMTGPPLAVDNAIVIFDGTSGSTVKDSGVLLSDLATVASLGNKVDKVAGKGLSTNDFTNVDKAKLDGLTTGGFVGSFSTLVALQAAYPTAAAGNWAIVVNLVDDLLQYDWDPVNTVWTAVGDPLTGAEISALLFAEPDTNNFDDAYKALVDGAVQQTYLDGLVASLGEIISAVVDNTINEPTTSRTLQLTDINKYIRLTNGSGCTITLPSEASMAPNPWTQSPEIRFRIATATTPTFSLGVGVNVNGIANLAGLGQDDVFRIKRIGPDDWDFIMA